MTPEEIQQRIAELQTARAVVQAEVDRQLNYRFGIIDGQIALLQELLEGTAGDERPDTPQSG